jgi:hypothetical protein
MVWHRALREWNSPISFRLLDTTRLVQLKMALRQKERK